MEQASFLFSGPAPAQGPPVLSVSEVVRAAKGMLETAFGDVWVVGEVSGYRPSSAGHLYFDLKDEAGVLTAVCFRNVAQGFSFQIENGLELICHGRLSIYEKGGKFQIILDHCEPKGIGALQLAFEQLKQQLLQEGLFDTRRKKPLPFLPRRVGVVTSPTGAALRDILTVLRRRFAPIEVLIAPTRVQGEGAAAEVAAAIALLDARGDCDVLIVGRGGGSLEDLWAFNEEVVARAIFAARTPIVSAVGHEVDVTIADFVADLRAPTPSAAAELVVPARHELQATVRERRHQLAGGIRRAWELKQRRFREWCCRMRPPTARFPDWLLQIDHCRERLVFGTRTIVEQRRGRLAQRAAELQHLSPLAVLAKGYAVVCKAGTSQPVRRAGDLATGDRIAVRLAEGRVEAEVTGPTS